MKQSALRIRRHAFGRKASNACRDKVLASSPNHWRRGKAPHGIAADLVPVKLLKGRQIGTFSTRPDSGIAHAPSVYRCAVQPSNRCFEPKAFEETQ